MPSKIFSIAGRLGRLRYFGFVCFLCAVFVIVALRALDGSTAGWMGSSSLGLHLVGLGVSLLFILLFSIRRGRDLGWSPWLTTVIFVVCLLITMLFPIFIVALSVVPGDAEANAAGPRPPQGGVGFWLLAAISIAAVGSYVLTFG